MLEAVRALQEDTPPHPSEIAKDAAVRRALRGDLDHVILHALEKEPSHRYPSVEAFASDLQRYLDGYPVQAHGESVAGRAAKFVRRHRAWVAAGIVMVVLAVFSAITIVRSAAVAREQRARAERRFNDLRDLAKSYVFELDTALEAIPGTTKVRAMMTKRALTYLDRLSTEANGDLLLQRELANGYSKLATVQGVALFANLGDRAGARSSIEKALRLRMAILAANPGSVEDRFLLAASSSILGQIELTNGDPDRALIAHQRALQESEAIIAHAPHPTGRQLNVAGSSNLYVAQDYAGNGPSPHLGNPVAALPLLLRGLELITREGEVRQKESTFKTANVYRFSNQAVVENGIGNLLANELGRTQEGQGHIERALRLLHTPGIDLTNAEIRRKLLVFQQSYAELLLRQRKLRQANDAITSCRTIALELRNSDPENIAAASDYYATQVLSGRERLLTGGSQSGLTEIEDGLQGLRLMHEQYKQNAFIRASLTLAYLAAGSSALEAHEIASATKYFQEAVELARGAAAAHPSDASAELELSRGENGLAACARTERDAAAAREHAGAAERAAHQVLLLHPDNPHAQALVAEARQAR